MTLEELEQKCRPKEGTTTQGWGTKVWVLETDLAKIVKALKAASYLSQKINPVTARHRHGCPWEMPSMDALCNAQIAYEEALADLEQP